MRISDRKTLTELLSLPTSTFNEYYVGDYIRRWAARRPAIGLTADAFGNLWARLRRGRVRAAQPLVFSAHMDHPGFEAVRMIRHDRLHAMWRGDVLPGYFRGTRVRFFCEGQWVRGTIMAIRSKMDRGQRCVHSVTVAVPRPVPRGSIGMWDLPDPVIRGSRIYARSCDDVAGVAVVLAALDELTRARGPIDVYAAFTRAEEIGFAGAIAACHDGLLPKRARIISIETSSEIPGVKMGDGPILRVADKSSVFTPHLTTFCHQVAGDLHKRDRRFAFQRKVMDGGNCESTVFCEYGHTATGLCLALGNYHNMDTRRQRIAPEYIDLDDFSRLVKWLAALATSKRPCGPDNPELRLRLDRLTRKWLPTLKRTADLPGRAFQPG